MSGYVERTYVFEGEIPGKFFEDVHSPSWDARHLKVFGVGLSKFGDAIEVVLSADTDEVIDWHMQNWKEWERK